MNWQRWYEHRAAARMYMIATFLAVAVEGVDAQLVAPADALCNSCGVAGAKLRCSGCYGARYCSVACQRLHYGTPGAPHKRACRSARCWVEPFTRPEPLPAIDRLTLKHLVLVAGDETCDDAEKYTAHMRAACVVRPLPPPPRPAPLPGGGPGARSLQRESKRRLTPPSALRYAAVDPAPPSRAPARTPQSRAAGACDGQGPSSGGSGLAPREPVARAGRGGGGPRAPQR